MRARALVGWNLRRIRVSRGLSQESLGLQAKLEPSYVGRIERGRENTTVETLEAIADVLDLPLVEFFQQPAPDAAVPATLRAGRKRKGALPPEVKSS